MFGFSGPFEPMDRRTLRHAPTRPIVLIVEGDEDTRAMYAFALSASGFDIIAVKDGGEAYVRALQIHPDLIVADLPMPNHDGRRLLENLKQNSRTRDIPFVAMSADVQPSDERVDREGFAAFFPKPSFPDELAAVLRSVLDRHAHVRQ